MSWQVLDDVSPTARKQHICDTCGRRIEPGETYRRIRYVGDDGPGVHKGCQQCEAVLAEIWRTDPDIRYMDDGVDVGEYLREYRIEPLATMFRNRWAGIALADVPLDVLATANR